MRKFTYLIFSCMSPGSRNLCVLALLSIISAASSTPAAAGEGEVLTDIDFVFYDKPRTSNPCGEIVSPDGKLYVWDPDDINAGAGSVSDAKYIYLCKRFDPISTAAAITDVTIVTHENSVANPCPSGWEAGAHSIEGAMDLNKGQGSETDYIYLCYRKGGEVAITDVDIVGFGACPEHFNLVDQNLNETALGFPTHLCYSNLDDTAFSFNCGGEGEEPCTVFDTFYWENGNGSCDRSLAEFLEECRDFDRRRQFAVTDFQQTWTHWALLHQVNDLVRDVPIGRFTMIGSHNAYNNEADGYLIPNQKYSITDQLRAGLRLIDLDIHAGDDNGERLVTGTLPELCHGAEDTHSGCVIGDRLFDSALKEIRNWLLTPEGLDQTIVILLEDYIDVDSFEVEGSISRYLDRVDIGVFGLTDKAALEVTLPSRAQMLSLNKRVLILSQNRQYGNYVHKKTLDGEEVTSSKGGVKVQEIYDYFGRPYHVDGYGHNDGQSPEFACNSGPSDDGDSGVFGAKSPALNIKAQEVTGDRLIGAAEWINASHLEELSRCAIDFVNIDMVLAVDGDNHGERLKGAIWSWEEGDRGDGGDAVMFVGDTGRWRSVTSSWELPFACLDQASDDDPTNDSVKVTTGTGTFSQGWDVCRAEFPSSDFMVPTNGWLNQKLRDANPSEQNLWINYGTLGSTDGSFIINRPPGIELTGPGEVNEGPMAVSFTFTIVDNAPETVTVDVPDCGLAGEYASDSLAMTTNGGSFGCVFATGGTTSNASTSGVMVQLTGTDATGLSATGSSELTIHNVAPQLEILSLSGSAIDENDTLSLSGQFTDPGRDVHELQIDWGDGNSETVALEPGVREFAASHRYLDDAPTGTPADLYALSVTVADEIASATERRDIYVNNVAPSVELDSPVDEYGNRTNLVPVYVAVSVTGRVADVGSLDTHDISIAWGDGSFGEAGSLSSVHRYMNAGEYTVEMSAIDDDTSSARASVRVTVLSAQGALNYVAGQLDLQSGSSRSMKKALQWLNGSAGGRARNGAQDALARGKADLAIARIQRTLKYISAAEGENPLLNLAPLRNLLVLTMQSIKHGNN